MQVLRYLHGSKSWGLNYTKIVEPEVLNILVDASYAPPHEGFIDRCRVQSTCTATMSSCGARRGRASSRRALLKLSCWLTMNQLKEQNQYSASSSVSQPEGGEKTDW